MFWNELKYVNIGKSVIFKSDFKGLTLLGDQTMSLNKRNPEGVEYIIVGSQHGHLDRKYMHLLI